MNRHLIPFICTCAAAAFVLSGCGDRTEGKYAYIYGLSSSSELIKAYRKDPDKAVGKGIKDSKKSYYIKFEDDEFDLSIPNYDSIRRFSGTFEKEDDGVLSFDYEKLTVSSGDNQTVYKRSGGDTRQSEAAAKMLKDYSSSGSYPASPCPAVNANDKLASYSYLPLIMAHGTYNGTDTLVHKGDFLCVETYGFELDGKYKQGKDFTIKYDPETTMKKDPLSSYNKNEDRDDARDDLETRTDRIAESYNSSSVKTTIEFSDGKWKWYNSKGKLINKGKYSEGDEYEGIISMYITDNSEEYNAMFDTMMPLIFYIADDEKIYYPIFVRTD